MSHHSWIHAGRSLWWVRNSGFRTSVSQSFTDLFQTWSYDATSRCVHTCSSLPVVETKAESYGCCPVGLDKDFFLHIYNMTIHLDFIIMCLVRAIVLVWRTNAVLNVLVVIPAAVHLLYILLCFVRKHFILHNSIRNGQHPESRSHWPNFPRINRADCTRCRSFVMQTVLCRDSCKKLKKIFFLVSNTYWSLFMSNVDLNLFWVHKSYS